MRTRVLRLVATAIVVIAAFVAGAVTVVLRDWSRGELHGRVVDAAAAARG